MFHNLSIMRSARVAVETCMNAKPGENVSVVTDTGKLKITDAFAYAATALEGQITKNGTLALTLQAEAVSFDHKRFSM